MKSRMERYYEVDSDTSTRTSKNADLYQKIYENEEYNNIEGIATTLKPNEIDISKIKEMLKKKEQPDNYKDLMPKPIEITDSSFSEDDEKNYDIRDILDKAKSERSETNTHHKLSDSSYEMLKELNHKKENNNDKEELKELIHTITNTSMLHKLGDQDMSTDLLDELKSDTMVGDASSIREALAKEKEELKDDNYFDDEKQNMDKSFFTSSLNFKEEDFDELQEMNRNVKKNERLMNVLIFILLVIFTTCIIFYFLK